MTLERKLIRSESYLGRTIEARYMGPDLLAFVNGADMGVFYIDAQAAIDGGKRYVDHEEKSKKDLEERAKRTT